MPTVYLGRNATLNLNRLGTYESPDWSRNGNVQNLSRTSEAVEADVSIRENGEVGATQVTMLNYSVEFDAIWDPGHADTLALHDAHHNTTLLDIALLNGPITEPGSKGIRAYWAVTKFDISEEMQGVQMAKVTLKPGLGAHPPTRMTI